MSYTQEQRDEAIRLRELGWSYRAIAAKIGVSRTAIWNWCCNFAAESTQNDMSRKKNKATRAIGARAPQYAENHQSGIQETDAQKIARLEKELKNAQLMVELYEELVDVAEEQFNISIRKKVGAKR